VIDMDGMKPGARVRTRTLALALSAVLGACGGSGPGSGTGTSSGPGGASATGPGSAAGGATTEVCQWLTTDEIKAATGVAVTARSHSTLPPNKYCEWSLQDGTNSLGIAFKRLVAITVYAGKTSYDVMAQGASPVPGIGDAAAEVDGQVTVLKGSTHYAVVVVLRQPGDDDPALRAKESSASHDLAAAAAIRV
jgi:hypothetical protein